MKRKLDTKQLKAAAAVGVATSSRAVAAAEQENISPYQVFRDQNGIAYLRVTVRKNAAEFVVNKGFSVELILVDRRSANGLYLQPVPGASVLEAARRLLNPLNSEVTISHRASQHLNSILNNKEILMKATAEAAAKTPKFAKITAPPAKAAKKSAAPAAKAASKSEPKTAKKAAATKASTNGASGSRGAYAPEQKITVLQKDNPRREGTKAHEWYELYRTAKTVGGYLEKGGDRGYLTNDVKRGLIKIS